MSGKEKGENDESKPRALVGLFIASAIVPLTVAGRAGVPPPENCCYGTTCPDRAGCTVRVENVGPWQCKRTCVNQPACNCTDGDGCCQFRVGNCVYSGPDPCPSYGGVSVIDVSWSDISRCYASGGGQVNCCLVAQNTQCAQ